MSTFQTQSASIKVNIFEVMPFHEVYPGLGFPKNFWDIQYQCVHYSGWRVQEMVLQDPTSSWFAFWLCEGSLHSDVEGVSGMYMLVTSKISAPGIDSSWPTAWSTSAARSKFNTVLDRRPGSVNTLLAWPRSWSDSWKSWSISVLIFPIMPASSVGGIPALNGRWSRATCTFKTNLFTYFRHSLSFGRSFNSWSWRRCNWGCRLWT